MSLIQYSRPIPRAERRFAEQFDWGVAYQGTRQQLIQAGVLQPGEFPGEPGRAPNAYTLPSGVSVYRWSYRKGKPITERTYFGVHVPQERVPEALTRDAGFKQFVASVLATPRER